MQGLSLGGGGGGGGSDDDDEELFRPKRAQAEQQAAAAGPAALGAPDALDSSRAAVPAELLAAWRDEGAAERLRNRFVTGGALCTAGGRGGTQQWCRPSLQAGRRSMEKLGGEVDGARASKGRRSGRLLVAVCQPHMLLGAKPPSQLPTLHLVPPPACLAGDWGEGEARASARPAEEGEDGEGGEGDEVFGDFEDVETGEAALLWSTALRCLLTPARIRAATLVGAAAAACIPRQPCPPRRSCTCTQSSHALPPPPRVNRRALCGQRRPRHPRRGGGHPGSRGGGAGGAAAGQEGGV